MGFFSKIFKTEATPVATKSSEQTDDVTANGIVKWSHEYIHDITVPIVAGGDYLNLFKNIPEVFWPIDYIASRVAGAHFNLKRTSDDSIVWCNRRVNDILSKPNCIMGWRDLVYNHFVNKLCTGNAFFRAAMSDTFKDAEKWRMCSHFWELPANYVQIQPKNRDIPLFGIAEIDDLIEHYRLSHSIGNAIDIPTYQIWHDKDGSAEYYSGSRFLKSSSRLSALNKPISNLIAVYEARNIIYVKRGGIGFLVGQKRDVTGTVALTKAEKEELLKDHYEQYGIGRGQLPYGVSDVPMTFVRTNLSISDLQPFDETLMDAISIASIFGIPSVLVPRKDQSTFSNQSTAEKSVYCGTVIPLAKKFCADITAFLGLEKSGYYLDCDFSFVDCLQQGLKESEELKTLINTRCSEQFDKGLITLNDWRSQIHESMIDDIPLFGKLKFQMTDSELDIINRVFNTKTGGGENGRANQKPTVQNQGK